MTKPATTIRTVLVIDDSPDKLALTAEYLRLAGYRVLKAGGGQEGLELAEKHFPDLVVSDIVMPDVDGIELCRRFLVHHDLAATPILLVSALRKDAPSVVEALAAGADDFLESPYEPMLLSAKVAQLIERSHLNTALKRSHNLLQSLFEGTTDAIYVKDLNSRYVLVNSAGAKLFGKSVEEVIGGALQDFVTPESASRIIAADTRVITSGQSETTEHTVTEHGVAVTWLTTRAPYRDALGRTIGTVAISHDITKRKQMEEAVRENEERYRLMFDSSPHPMWLFDLESLAFLAVNDAMVNLYGYSREEFLQMTMKDIRPPEDIPWLLDRIRLTRGLEWRATRSHQKKDGTIIEVEVTSNELTINGRRALLVLGSEITERKRSEAALRESEERYRLLFDSHPHPMWVYATETLSFLAVNDATVRHYGYSREEFLNMTLLDLRPPEDLSRFVESIKLVKGSHGRSDWRHRKKDGSIIDVEVTATDLNLTGPEARLVLAIDITERKQTEEALHQTEEQLRQAVKMEAVGRLAGGVAHDFNNLLSAIIGYSDLLLLRSDDKVREYVQEIKAAGERAAGLTRQLLAFSRKQVLQPKVTDINSLVAGMSKMLRRLIGEDIELVLLLRPDAGAINADPSQLEQVLMNLVINARDAMPSGGKLIIESSGAELDNSYVVLNDTVPSGQYVMLKVSDTGTGMDAETRGHIFEPFFTTKELGKGTGLGLSTVYGIVAQSGGYISVYSEPGMGTTFKIAFPRVEQEVVQTRSSLARAELQRGTETVLLVDDEPLVRKLAKQVLELSGYKVIEAANGAEALRAFKRQQKQIDLILTDVVMPLIGGPELAEQIRQLTPEMPIIYMSGYTDEAIIHHGVLAPGSPFLEKPFTPSVLTRKVRERLDAQRSKSDKN